MAVETAASSSNVFEDLSGVSGTTSGNPYDALLSLCQNDQVVSVSFFPAFLDGAFEFMSFGVDDGVPYAERLASHEGAIPYRILSGRDRAILA